MENKVDEATVINSAIVMSSLSDHSLIFTVEARTSDLVLEHNN